MKKLIFLFSLALVLSLFTSCKKDDIKGDATVTVSAGIVNSPATITSTASTQTSSLDFTSGYVWISEIVFDGDMKDGTSVSKTVERFSKIDFTTGVANPSLDDIIIPMGEYNSINLGVELRDVDNQPSIVMEGIYTRMDGSTAPIRFEFNSGEVFEAESEGASVQIDQIAISKITFDPAIWFSVISSERLDDANVDGSGVIVISETTNSDIFDDVANRLDVSTQAVF